MTIRFKEASLFDDLDDLEEHSNIPKADAVAKKKSTKKKVAKKKASEKAPTKKTKKKASKTARSAREAAGGAKKTPARKAAAAPPKERKRSDAESMAKRQREISVSEFFTKNRHLLGFDSPLKALLTAVKEAVDNSLDACEEAGILPEITVEISQSGENRYRMAVEDNGPGVVRDQVAKIFGKLLYGSKFHKLSQSRGQQGIGISAAGMYGQLTTGKPVLIRSRTGARNRTAGGNTTHPRTTTGARGRATDDHFHHVHPAIPHTIQIRAKQSHRHDQAPIH